MEMPLDKKLEALGFVNVLYTKERLPDGRERAIKRAPKSAHRTYGTFRNVTVVYDHLGRPWVRERPLKYQEILDMDLIVGGSRAWVPHVDDGGEYLQTHYSQFRNIEVKAPRHKPR